MQRTLLATLVAGLFSLPVQAQEIPNLDEIVVTATRIATPDVLATYASEVHTRQMIEHSGASTLYGYLAQQTSVNVLPNTGNRYAPLIDMRGYGAASGYQNIVVTVDGRRLNNIDLSPALLGTIPLTDIDRIEITKGSGSVLFGDGAAAGSIQIYTRPHSGAAISAQLGNQGTRGVTATAGVNTETASLSASADYAGLDGYSAADPSGNKDASSNRTWRGSLELRPLERLKFSLDGSSSRIDARFPSPLTLAQFEADPAQVGRNPWATPVDAYTHQLLNSDQWGIGLQAELAPGLRLNAKHNHEDKQSTYAGWSPSSYAYASDDLGLRYDVGALSLAAGAQIFDGARSGSSDRSSKDNSGYYLQGQYRIDHTTLSLGGRREKVEYGYTPQSGPNLDAAHKMNAWDIGVNQTLDAKLSLFANYNQAFQAPDIDRFFTSFDPSGNYTGPQFNGFIQPETSHTLNLGLNFVTPGNRLKLALFRANLDNEIYYYSSGPWSGYNTNFDKTHKYGLELQDSWHATATLTARINYNYTRAIIDQAIQDSIYNGKDLPGVPRQGVTLGLNWQASQTASVNLTHTWRSQSHAANDFANDFTQQQAAYQSTHLALRYRLKNLEWSAAVDNLFAHQNAEWISDDALYPVDFTRNWRLGLKASF